MEDQQFGIGYNSDGSPFVDLESKLVPSEAEMTLNREQLIQLQQSITFALKYYPPTVASEEE